MTVYKNIISTKGDEIEPQSEPRVGPGPRSHRACDLERIFALEFASSYHTRLVGGASEPLYSPVPAQVPMQVTKQVTKQITKQVTKRGGAHEHECEQQHCIYYRENYFASALHEIAHWCIAGPERRQQTDYGYWYAPDGRGAQQQRAFEMAEQKPQALEWIFSIICGTRFSVSVDNLYQSLEATEEGQFVHAVQYTALGYCGNGLPTRASQFASALNCFYRGTQAPPFMPFVTDALQSATLPAGKAEPLPESKAETTTQLKAQAKTHLSKTTASPVRA